MFRRKMCWTIDSVLYHTFNNASYDYKSNSHDAEFRKIYRKWNKMDYLFYDYFNQSLWKQIEIEGRDFWDELRFFRAVQQNVSDFCQEVLMALASVPVGSVAFRYIGGRGRFIPLGNRGLYTMFGGTRPFGMGGERVSQFYSGEPDPFMSESDEELYDGYYEDKDHIPKSKLEIPASKWSPAFTFDAERCMGMYFNPLVFKNLLRVRQHPHLCKALYNIDPPPPYTFNPNKGTPLNDKRLRMWWKYNLESFDPKSQRQAIFHPAYCSRPRATRYKFAEEVVFARNAYRFSYVRKG